jgi:hypothetical protein
MTRPTRKHMTHTTRLFLIAGCALATAPFGLAAQEPAPEPPPQPVEFELATFREVFSYPTFARRNPFLPLAAGGELRFEQLSLIGLIYSVDPSASVAILSTGSVEVADDGTLSATEGDAYYGKVGQRIGNVTIREIQRDRVIVDVDEFGLTERRTMVFSSRR